MSQVHDHMAEATHVNGPEAINEATTYIGGHQRPQLGQVWLIKRPPNDIGNLGLPSSNTGSWSSSNNNWEQPAYINPIPTVDLVIQTS